MKPIEIAIESAGNANRLAKGIGVPAQSVLFWRDGDRRIPAEYCPRIEAFAGVRCEDLRPDVQWSVLRNPAPEKAAVMDAAMTDSCEKSMVCPLGCV